MNADADSDMDVDISAIENAQLAKQLVIIETPFQCYSLQENIT